MPVPAMVVITSFVDTGDALGDNVGSDVGTAVGIAVGVLVVGVLVVGAAVGSPGRGVGTPVGIAVGKLDGCIVGAFVVDDDALILRTRLLLVSAMYTLPDESSATPVG